MKLLKIIILRLRKIFKFIKRYKVYIFNNKKIYLIYIKYINFNN